MHCLFEARWLLIGLALLVTAGCGEHEPTALGTLEWDRIALPAPAAEKIIEVRVREGQRVAAGEVVLALDPRQTRAQLQAAEAEVARQRAALAELQAGPRVEEIKRAEASLAAAEAEAVDRQADYRRFKDLGGKNFVSKSDVDGARAAAESAQAQVRAAREQLLELQRGYRIEEIEQGQAALQQAIAQTEALRVILEKLVVRAPRAGLVDSIPFKLGDEAPIGASLAVLLTGATPYARVYIPQPMRAGVKRNQRAVVFLAGSEKGYPGRVRMVRDDPSFTPYYALTGDDVARLSYIAEIQLQKNAVDLPAGLPLRAEFLPGIAEVPEPEVTEEILPALEAGSADTVPSIEDTENVSAGLQEQRREEAEQDLPAAGTSK
ncbi:HlyD family secretion protein [Microbulbifer aggregans]|uniref:HlyD family secretion protein n=1 Tax=Microbulbifer aggregans TaxID=1769779 RepID=UPI001CFF11E0|nr:HlyD family secretion protein [Microbulbifer aggregans]